jgi:hypothetical protein
VPATPLGILSCEPPTRGADDERSFYARVARSIRNRRTNSRNSHATSRRGSGRLWSMLTAGSAGEGPSPRARSTSGRFAAPTVRCVNLLASRSPPPEPAAPCCVLSITEWIDAITPAGKPQMAYPRRRRRVRAGTHPSTSLAGLRRARTQGRRLDRPLADSHRPRPASQCSVESSRPRSLSACPRSAVKLWRRQVRQFGAP